MSEKALVTPEVLKWARETAKLSITEIAHKMKKKESHIEAWEKGESYPTLAQAENLSKFYRRSLAVFFLPEPPKDFEALRDFRKINQQGEFSTALTFILREIQQKKIWMREYLEGEGEEKLGFIGSFTTKDPVEAVAKNIKEVLDIGLCPNNKDILKYWIEKIESKRIFVCLTSQIHSRLKIDKEEVQGFAISDDLAPFIFVNSGDYKNPQLFSLIHELAHLWINSSGVSNIKYVDFRGKDKNNFDEIELFCDEVAASVLMPKDEVFETLKDFPSQIDIKTVEDMSKIFRVSSKAMLVRLRNLGKIESISYQKIEMIIDKKYKDYLIEQEEKKKLEDKDIPLYYPLIIRRNSRSFTNYIYNMYRGGQITGSDACGLLNIKINTIKKLGNHLYT